jgi:hypothetical protein
MNFERVGLTAFLPGADGYSSNTSTDLVRFWGEMGPGSYYHSVLLEPHLPDTQYV